MKELFSRVKGDKIIRWGLLASIAILVFEGVYIGAYYFSLPPYVPLFNQLPWGENRLGVKVELLLPILLAFSFFILNYFLLSYLYERMPLLSRILGITTLLVSLLTFIFVMRTLQLIL